MSSQCLLMCPVCGVTYDWLRSYGGDIRCCSKECHTEAEWRRTLAIMGEPYRPDPKRVSNPSKAGDE